VQDLTFGKGEGPFNIFPAYHADLTPFYYLGQYFTAFMCALGCSRI
jgi:hypothetical protein